MSNNGTRLGMIRCEHCGRQFNPHSGARHIPWCAKQQSESKRQRLTAEKKLALERYKWRISYRPSNKVDSLRRSTYGALAGKIAANSTNKKSSVHSSATLSSPGSVTSASSSLASTSDLQRRKSIGSRQVSIPGKQIQLQQQQGRGNNYSTQLKRSVSSLTLTKQTGVRPLPKKIISISNNHSGDIDDDNAAARSLKQRTKSHGDLNDMNEIVETLAKRMEQIYAQNQILLANMSKRKPKTKSNSNDDASDSEMDDANSCGTYVRCHHCKTNCLEEANYCHKCGCKLRATLESPTC